MWDILEVTHEGTYDVKRVFGSPLPTHGFGRAPSIQRACPCPTCYLHRAKMHGLAKRENQGIRQYAAKQMSSAEK